MRGGDLVMLKCSVRVEQNLRVYATRVGARSPSPCLDNAVVLLRVDVAHNARLVVHTCMYTYLTGNYITTPPGLLLYCVVSTCALRLLSE